MKNKLSAAFAFSLALFGLLTLFLSTSIILDLFGIREKEGNYVWFVVWTNFICSLFYLVAVYGFINNKKWTAKLLGVATLILIITLIDLIYYIKTGGIYETKTISAMIFRTSLTLFFAIFSYQKINKRQQQITK